MQTTIPSTSLVLKSLLRADFTTQWRNRRSVMLVILVPVIILISWKPLISKIPDGKYFVLSNCITFGLTAIGLMGYSLSIARDRDKGIFQRIRVAPLATWTVMLSRLAVQLAMIMILTIAVFIIGYTYDEIKLSAMGYMLGFISAIVGGAMYLGLGQAIVGLVKNSETVNSTSRLIYFVFIMVGMFGELGMLGKAVGDIVKWSPYGTVRKLVADSLNPEVWTMTTTYALLATLAYAAIFATVGIKKFKWNIK